MALYEHMDDKKYLNMLTEDAGVSAAIGALAGIAVVLGPVIAREFTKEAKICNKKHGRSNPEKNVCIETLLIRKLKKRKTELVKKYNSCNKKNDPVGCDKIKRMIGKIDTQIAKHQHMLGVSKAMVKERKGKK